MDCIMFEDLMENRVFVLECTNFTLYFLGII